MHVLALSVELRLPQCRSLKDKRAVLRAILDGLRHRHQVAVAETAFQNQWQRSEIGAAVVSSSVAHCEERMDEVERFVWSRPDVEVTSTGRHWLEVDA